MFLFGVLLVFWCVFGVLVCFGFGGVCVFVFWCFGGLVCFGVFWCVLVCFFGVLLFELLCFSVLVFCVLVFGCVGVLVCCFFRVLVC